MRSLSATSLWRNRPSAFRIAGAVTPAASVIELNAPSSKPAALVLSPRSPLRLTMAVLRIGVPPLPVVVAAGESNFAVPAVPGATRAPSLRRMARQAADRAERSAVAASLFGMIWISPSTRRRPPCHSQTLPHRSEMPALVLSWRQLAGPEPVSTGPSVSPGTPTLTRRPVS
ncbi:hypothetical protein D9M70_519810 [compost metagenome]